jgi:hypothetical protein
MLPMTAGITTEVLSGYISFKPRLHFCRYFHKEYVTENFLDGVLFAIHCTSLCGGSSPCRMTYEMVLALIVW